MMKSKIQNALDEARMLVLGAQVLLGFQYNAVFQKGFERLPMYAQYLALGALCLMIVAFGLLSSPGPYHQLADRGKDDQGFHRYITRVVAVALFPFALGLGIDLYITVEKLAGTLLSVVAGVATALVAIFFWYGLEIFVRAREGKRQPFSRMSPPKEYDEEGEGKGEDSMKLEDRVKQVLTEARVVLPGAQALLGFQFIAILTEGFDKLPASSKYIHLASLSLIALSTVLLMTPAAYHRIVEDGNDTERFVRFASRMLLAAMVPLALGIVGDLFVVARKITESVPLGVGCALVMLVFFYGLWFGFSLLQRNKNKGLKGVGASAAR